MSKLCTNNQFKLCIPQFSLSWPLRPATIGGRSSRDIGCWMLVCIFLVMPPSHGPYPAISSDSPGTFGLDHQITVHGQKTHNCCLNYLIDSLINQWLSEDPNPINLKQRTKKSPGNPYNWATGLMLWCKACKFWVALQCAVLMLYIYKMYALSPSFKMTQWNAVFQAIPNVSYLSLR